KNRHERDHKRSGSKSGKSRNLESVIPIQPEITRDGSWFKLIEKIAIGDHCGVLARVDYGRLPKKSVGRVPKQSLWPNQLRHGLRESWGRKCSRIICLLEIPCSMTPIRADWDAELSAEILEPCSLEATPPPCFHASTNRKADRRLSFDYRRAP